MKNKKVTVFNDADLKSIGGRSAEAAIADADALPIPMDGGVDMTDLPRRMGRMLKVEDFIAALTRLNPSLIFQYSTGDPSKAGVYVPAPGKPEPRFICGMESGLNLSGLMPEFSIIDPSINRESFRGWRTVLAALIHDRLITTTQAELTFNISHGQDSKNWQQRTQPGIII